MPNIKELNCEKTEINQMGDWVWCSYSTTGPETLQEKPKKKPVRRETKKDIVDKRKRGVGWHSGWDVPAIVRDTEIKIQSVGVDY